MISFPVIGAREIPTGKNNSCTDRASRVTFAAENYKFCRVNCNHQRSNNKSSQGASQPSQNRLNMERCGYLNSLRAGFTPA